MKKIVCIILLITSLKVVSQNPLTINVESPDISAGDTLRVDHMSLFHYHGVDKTSFFVADENGKATIHDAVDSFSRLRLNIGNNDVTFYADAGQAINIKIDNPQDMQYVTPTGGFYDDPDYYDYISNYNIQTCKKNKALDKMQLFSRFGANDSANYYLAVYDSIGRQEDWKRENTFIKRTDHQVSVYMYAKNWGNDKVERKNFEKHWKELDDDIKTSGAGQFFKQIMESRQSLRPRAQARNFSIIDTQGNTIDLESQNGHFVLLYYWGVCGYVIQSCSDVVNLHEKYGKYLTTIALTEEETFNQVSRYNASVTQPILLPLKGLTREDWTNVLTDKHNNAQIQEDYLMMATPCVVLISPKGRIIKHGYANVLKVAKTRLWLYSLFHRK